LTESLPAMKNPISREQSNPFDDPCFTDNTKAMLGKSMAIIGAPPPQK
jgi:hypothetical protein